MIYRVPIDVVDISGADAAKILNNLTTQNMLELPGELQTDTEPTGEERAQKILQTVETFVTDVKGKSIAHGIVAPLNETERRLLLPATSVTPSFASRVRDHADKYTILEDATPVSYENQFLALVFRPQDIEIFKQTNARLTQAPSYACSWLGSGTRLLLIDGNDQPNDLPLEDITAFHDERIESGYPWYGIDMDESNLPQEANRDPTAISFTKGCYLGQETVARLDALGQVQKQLAHLSIQPCDSSAGENPVAVGDKLLVDGKPVVRFTSINREGTKAIAMVRRGYFEPGTQIEGTIEKSSTSSDASESIRVSVLEPSSR